MGLCFEGPSVRGNVVGNRLIHRSLGGFVLGSPSSQRLSSASLGSLWERGSVWTSDGHLMAVYEIFTEFVNLSNLITLLINLKMKNNF